MCLQSGILLANSNMRAAPTVWLGLHGVKQTAAVCVCCYKTVPHRDQAIKARRQGPDGTLEQQNGQRRLSNCKPGVGAKSQCFKSCQISINTPHKSNSRVFKKLQLLCQKQLL
jgi:hypothetical protein